EAGRVVHPVDAPDLLPPRPPDAAGDGDHQLARHVCLSAGPHVPLLRRAALRPPIRASGRRLLPDRAVPRPRPGLRARHLAAKLASPRRPSRAPESASAAPGDVPRAGGPVGLTPRDSLAQSRLRMDAPRAVTP